MSQEKKRRPNFTAQEISVLVEGVQSRKEVIFNSSNNAETNTKKKRAWIKIAEEVSAVSGISRNVDEIRKKWISVKSVTKTKAATNKRKAKKTDAGGPSPHLKVLEEKIIDVVGKGVVEGIEGVIDTAEPGKAEEDQINSNDDQASHSDEVSEKEKESLAVALLQGRVPGVMRRGETSESSEIAPKKKNGAQTEDAQKELLVIERERLEIEKKRLQIRLDVEREGLRVEKRRLEIEQEKIKPSKLVTKSYLQ